MVGDVPVVIPVSAIHDTLSCCQPATTSLKLCGGAEGLSARRCRNVAASARVNVSSGAKVVGDLPVVISVSAIHEIASFWDASVTSVNEWPVPASGGFSML